jgi:hypothetical protein
LIKIKQFFVCISLLILSVSCVPDGKQKPSTKAVQRDDEFTIFLTGYELGELKPCGCSGGQLGGLDRRWAVLSGVPKQKKLTIDVGSFIESDSEQDLIKYSILMQAFSLLGYDVVNLTRKDLEIARNLGLLFNPVVGFISPYGTGEKIAGKFQNQYLLKDRYITVSVLTCSLEASPIEQIKEVFPSSSDQQGVSILIIDRCDEAVISSIAELGTVDCIIFPSDSDEPRVISDPNERPLTFSVGRFGRYVCKLVVKAASDEQNRLDITFSTIPVVEKLKQGPSLVRLYKDYQHLVKEADLLEKFPRFALPDNLQYEGSKSCKQCHEYEYKMWSRKPHAQAYKTLVKVGSQYDPECVVCHVVGMDYESGYISEEKTSHLKNVGCENCHGPGSEHNRTEGLAKTTEPKSDCIFCHTPEKSAGYAGNEQEYLEKIRHWKELKAASNVQQ